MDEVYEKHYHKIEQDYWWFIARRDIIKKLMAGVSKDSKILEVGCSGGVLINELQNEGYTNVYGLDISKKAIDKCKEKGIKNVKISDAIKTGFEDKEFDLVIASDILEHVENEKEAVMEWKRILKKEGKLIIFVPAFKSLWSKHDEVNKHFKRYTNKALVNVIKDYFEIDKKGYWNFSLFFPIYAMRKFEKEKYNWYETNEKINKIMLNVLKIENYFIEKGVRFPVGISTFVLAKNI